MVTKLDVLAKNVPLDTANYKIEDEKEENSLEKDVKSLKTSFVLLN